jgi:hypothetical protein
MWAGEVDCVRYHGHNPALLARLAQAGLSDRADHPPPQHVRPARRDRVAFALSAETSLPACASSIASAFRADMRASGKKVLPALAGSCAVRLSWYRHQYHLVRFTDEGGGRFGARLRSRTALEGLAWLVHDWLRAKNAEAIGWEATGDPTSASPTPM